MDEEQGWITAFAVQPAYQRRGIASALFRYADEHLLAQGRKTVSISPYVPNYFIPGVDIEAYHGAVDFLTRERFKIVDRAISMSVDLSRFQIPEEIRTLEREREQDDITVRPVTAADLPELMPFIALTFGWDWFRHAQEYLLELFGGHNTRSICFLIARRQGKIVGYCQQRLERFGPFGVDPDCRNLGIGRLLLFNCLASMRARQTYYAYFLWTGDDAARLYSLAGFKRRREFVIMQKNLDSV
jgi:ribosomal protein S18 acetylase RimI-like enzyme